MNNNMDMVIKRTRTRLSPEKRREQLLNSALDVLLVVVLAEGATQISRKWQMSLLRPFSIIFQLAKI